MPSNSLNTVSFHNDSSLLVYNSVQQHQPSIQRPAFDLDEFLKKHLFFTKSKIIYQKDDLVALCLQARLALQQDNSSMSALITIPYLPINIVGDIHGQWRDLLRIFSTLGVPGKARYLFLGDYVDRGKRSLECISLLLALKIKYPKMIYLLRGNHECDYINWNYGFQKDCSERFSLGDAMEVFKAFNELFNYLPLAAIVVDRILCMHGGISPKLTSLDALRKIHLPIKVAHDDQLPLDLLWSDPMPKDKAEKERGFIENDLRECSYYFGADAVINLCTKLGLDLIVRGHQSMKNGFGFFAQRRLLTIFSAPGYTVTEKPIFGTDEKIYTPSFGAVAKITRNFELSIVIFRPRTLADTRTFEEIYEENNSGQGPGTESEITVIEKMPKDLPSDSLMGRVP